MKYEIVQVMRGHCFLCAGTVQRTTPYAVLIRESPVTIMPCCRKCGETKNLQK